MPDLTPTHALTVIVLLISIVGLLWITWRMDCRARRAEARRLAQEASYREAQDALDRALKRRRDRLSNPDFRYTPE